MNPKSFPAANPYVSPVAGVYVLGAAIMMVIDSHCIYAADVGPDPGNHLQLFASFP